MDAWLELAELTADEDFQRTTRQNALRGTGPCQEQRSQPGQPIG
jgi:hypothetical protein